MRCCVAVAHCINDVVGLSGLLHILWPARLVWPTNYESGVLACIDILNLVDTAVHPSTVSTTLRMFFASRPS